ncbi:MAG: hypothetical protein J0M05_05215 [Candidatus Kapabacteria bacterium]|nr:hypothetical protein [Candidatus Kapabacteria bacterium]
MKVDDTHSSKQRDYEMSGMGVIVDMEVHNEGRYEETRPAYVARSMP